MLMEEAVLREAKPSMESNSVLLAIKRPPPIVFNNGMEMFVNEESATKATSPPTLVKFGAKTPSM